MDTITINKHCLQHFFKYILDILRFNSLKLEPETAARLQLDTIASIQDLNICINICKHFMHGIPCFKHVHSLNFISWWKSGLTIKVCQQMSETSIYCTASNQSHQFWIWFITFPTGFANIQYFNPSHETIKKDFTLLHIYNQRCITEGVR